jgi:hypothetical protein
MTDTTLTSRIRSWLNDLPIGDPVNRRMASLLQILLIGFMGIILRVALSAALERESELKNEINIREQAEAALEQFAARLEILQEIDRYKRAGPCPSTNSLSARQCHNVQS